MNEAFLRVSASMPLVGSVPIFGAKNAVLVIIASLILTRGKSVLTNVPASGDVLSMMEALGNLGAVIEFFPAEHRLIVDTTNLTGCTISPLIMKRTRASILFLGPLLARFGTAYLGLPGGDEIGSRPIDFHLKNFAKMGVKIEQYGAILHAQVKGQLTSRKLVLDYPSVGATENLLMAAATASGTTILINAAFEPEVFDLIKVLQNMGAHITLEYPNTLVIKGVKIDTLAPIEHKIMPDRLEAGSILIAAAVTGGHVYLPDVPAHTLDVFLLKLEEMGHTVTVGKDGWGIGLKATSKPQAVSFKTGSYPEFPTDLQAPFMVAQCLATGLSVIEETVHDNRLRHVPMLCSMGADIQVYHTRAVIKGGSQFHAAKVHATDIRASCALVIAGMAAAGTTLIFGAHHWQRGYDQLEYRLNKLGASIIIEEND